MLSRLAGGGPTPTVVVMLDTRVFFIHPLHPTLLPISPEPSSRDAIVRGAVAVFLPTPRKVKSLEVIFTGTCSAHGAIGGWSKEVTQTIRTFIGLDISEDELGAGKHLFEFSFVIPSTTAVTGGSNGDGPVGVVQHSIGATLESDGGFFYPSIISPRRCVIIAALESDPSDPPSNYQFHHELNHIRLGPTRILLFSPHLTQGALVSLHIFVASSSEALTIRNVRLYISQTSFVTYEDRKRPPTHVHDYDLALVDPSPDAHTSSASPPYRDHHVLPAGDSWTYDGVFRLPDCEVIWSTTLPGSDATVSVSHKLVVDIEFAVSGGTSSKSVRIESPVTIESCVSLDDSLILPSYSADAGKTIVRYSEHGMLCQCNYTLRELLERYEEPLKVAKNQAVAAVPVEVGLPSRKGERT